MPAGRPPMYKTPEAMQEVIDQYFDSVTYEHPETGQKICQPTVAGLSYELGFSRQAFNDYKKKDQFLDTIKRARQRIEIALETNLYRQAVTGTIFNLKNNFDWKDKTEVDQNSNMSVSINAEDVKAL